MRSILKSYLKEGLKFRDGHSYPLGHKLDARIHEIFMDFFEETKIKGARSIKLGKKTIGKMHTGYKSSFKEGNGLDGYEGVWINISENPTEGCGFIRQ